MATRIAAEEFRDGDHAAIATMPSPKAASSDDPEASSSYANRFALGQLWASGNAGELGQSGIVEPTAATHFHADLFI